jgi:hypothetical protein
MRRAYFNIEQCKEMIRFASNYKWWCPKYWFRSEEGCKVMKIRWLKELKKAVIDKPRLGKVMTDSVSGKKTIITSISYSNFDDYSYETQEYRPCKKN